MALQLPGSTSALLPVYLLPPVSDLLYPLCVKRLRVGVLYGGRSGSTKSRWRRQPPSSRISTRSGTKPFPIRIEKDGRWCLADKAPTAMSAAEVIEQARLDAARPLRHGREVHMIARPSEETVLSIDRSAPGSTTISAAPP